VLFILGLLIFIGLMVIATAVFRVSAAIQDANTNLRLIRLWVRSHPSLMAYDSANDVTQVVPTAHLFPQQDLTE
jgi:hypothetical protein